MSNTHSHAATPLEHSLKLMRKHGFSVESVQRYNPQLHETRGLFGIFDAIAVKDSQVMAIVATDLEDIESRKLEVMKSPEAQAWVRSGNWISIHGWRRGKPRRQWNVTIQVIK